MFSQQNPYTSPCESGAVQSTRLGRAIIGVLAGGLLGGIALSQFLSTMGLFLDLGGDAGMAFRLTGVAAGLLLGMPAGARAGWLVGRGLRRVNWRTIGVSAVLCCALFCSTLILVLDRHGLEKAVPLFGLGSGAVLGAIISVLIPPIRSRQRSDVA